MTGPGVMFRFYSFSTNEQAVTRYMLQKLFGPNVAQVTSDGSILFLDLPANMVKAMMHSS